MSQLIPAATTVGDLITASLKEAGALGVGQTPLAEDSTDAWARLQWMLQQWERQRWLIYHLVTYVIPMTGKLYYTIGPGGDFDTGVGTARPDKLETGCFLRQGMAGPLGVDFNTDFNYDFLVGGAAGPLQVDYPLTVLESMEDYNNIPLKGMVSFPQNIFLDASWPLGKIFAWPVPQANIYSLGVLIKEQLPTSFASLATVFNLPYEYYEAIRLNLALRLRSKYQIPTFPGDMLPGLAKASLAVVRGANTGIAALRTPPELNRPGIYNIFSDRSY